jgi:hypothetical protein
LLEDQHAIDGGWAFGTRQYWNSEPVLHIIPSTRSMTCYRGDGNRECLHGDWMQSHHDAFKTTAPEDHRPCEVPLRRSHFCPAHEATWRIGSCSTAKNTISLPGIRQSPRCFRETNKCSFIQIYIAYTRIYPAPFIPSKRGKGIRPVTKTET